MKTRLLIVMSLFALQFSFAKTLLVVDPITPVLSPLTYCDPNNDGFGEFDFADINYQILAAQTGNASDYVITYHETVTQANTGSSPLSSPYYNINSFTQTIYYRVRNVTTNLFAVGSFELVVNSAPFVPELLNSIILCDNDSNPQSASTLVDLTIVIPSILAQQPLAMLNYRVTFYDSLVSASSGIGAIVPSTSYFATNVQTVWCRVETISTGCYSVGSFQLIVNTPLALTTPSPLSVCDDDANPNDQITTFNLTVKNAEITQSIPNYIVTYYPSLANAQSNTNAIADPTRYVNTLPAVQTLGVIVTSPEGCESLTTLDIRVMPIPTPLTNLPTLTNCDGNNDGSEFFDLTLNSSYITNGDPNLTFHYYNTLSDANSRTNEILIPTAYASSGGSVWIRVENTRVDFQGNQCYSIVQQNLAISNTPSPIIVASENSICVDFLTNAVTRSLTLQTTIGNPTAYNFEWYEISDLSTILGTSSTYSVDISALDGRTRGYLVRVSSSLYPSCSGFASPYQVIQSGTAAITPQVPSGYSVIDLSGVQSIVVSISGFGVYEYSLDSGPHQASNIFENVPLGIHSVRVWDIEGRCDPLVINNIVIATSQISAPTGLNSQTFAPGATLANIVVNGTNVKWYATATNRTTLSTPLPLNTVLVDGTTYYATQTINDIESQARLPVTVHIALGVPTNEILPLQFAPNPVKNSLTLQSTQVLKSVMVYTMLGQKVFEQNYDTTEVTIDLSKLSTGSYILKAEGDVGQKTIRILKE